MPFSRCPVRSHMTSSLTLFGSWVRTDDREVFVRVRVLHFLSDTSIKIIVLKGWASDITFFDPSWHVKYNVPSRRRNPPISLIRKIPRVRSTHLNKSITSREGISYQLIGNSTVNNVFSGFRASANLYNGSFSWFSGNWPARDFKW